MQKNNNEIEKCCICGEEIEGYGNNALPLVRDLCCDDCNHEYVIPARVYYNAKEQGQQRMGHDFILALNQEAVVGAKVLIVEMKDEPQYRSKFGIIEYIDDLGQLHGTWGGCALIPSEDTYFIIKQRKGL